MIDRKPRPNHRLYIETLRRMTSQQRLEKAFELTESSRELFREGLRHRFPQLSATELQRVYMGELEKCHNRNY